MLSEEGLLQAIEANPDDEQAKLALADWLDDQGRGDTAYAWRWMVLFDVFPRRAAKVPSRAPWSWKQESSLKRTWAVLSARALTENRARLPKAVYVSLRGRSVANAKRYASLPAAVADLGTALRVL